MLWYAVIFAFRSTFSIKFSSTRTGSSSPPRAPSTATLPRGDRRDALFGWLADRIGRTAPLLAFGALLLPLAMLVIMPPALPLWIGTVLIGVSYSLVPAVLWPLASRIVPAARLGTALAALSVGLNVGIAAANLAAGCPQRRVRARALENPAGYDPMMIMFAAGGTLGSRSPCGSGYRGVEDGARFPGGPQEIGLRPLFFRAATLRPLSRPFGSPV